MQVFRLVGGPDKIIAFDSLPKRLLSGFDMINADAFPRHWKEWMGKTEHVAIVPPEKDPLTGAVRQFNPIVTTDHYFYMVDWSLGPVVEKWKAICEFVRSHVSKDVELKEKIEDMAKPLAGNLIDSPTLEPEDVVVIPIPEEFQEKDGKVVKAPAESIAVKCTEEGCKAEYEGPHARQALRMHAMKKHKEAAAAK